MARSLPPSRRLRRARDKRRRRCGSNGCNLRYKIGPASPGQPRPISLSSANQQQMLRSSSVPRAARSNPNENPAKSTNPIDGLPLIRSGALFARARQLRTNLMIGLALTSKRLRLTRLTASLILGRFLSRARHRLLRWTCNLPFSFLARRAAEPHTQSGLEQYAPSIGLLQRVQRKLIQIDDLCWREFEQLVAKMLEADGYFVELMKGSKDGGVDVVCDDLGDAGSLSSFGRRRSTVLIGSWTLGRT